MGGNGGRTAVKVVIINTQFVETDERSFKSVVQSLTGKDSTIPADAQPPPSFVSGGGVPYNSGPVFTRGISYKDFERMLSELPPLDELNSYFP